MRPELFGAMLMLGMLGTSPSRADLISDPTFDTCVTTNCGSELLRGSIRRYAHIALACVGQFYLGQAECLRLEVTEQTQDLEITVVAPDGTVYRDNNSGGSLRPLVRINGTPNYAFHTVFISTANGLPEAQNFNLLHGRYNVDNPNCLPATPPL